MSGVEDMIAAAVKTLGVGEHNGDNTNYITAWYGLDGQPWCDQAVTYWAAHSGNYDAVCFGTKHAYTVEHAQKFKDRGAWHAMTSGVANSGICRGDVIFFDWSGGSSIAGIDHVGIVESVNGSVVHTIEGNYGNVCGRFSRTAEVIAGFGRPVYVNPTPKPAPAPAPAPAPKYVPFPGASFFREGRNSPVVTALGKRLVAERCGRYEIGPGPIWSDADQASYAAWQRKLGFSGSDADGTPGKTSWDKLQVPA
ncbi:peptidoglycan-binding protein [Streptomyces sp. NPDC101227]|uniref:peptidoglycan-binding protein n=1 Tax=Streptomyces sp. NPDC101227 TaxID=3366136 RepID=UPI0037F9DFE6